MTFKWLDFSNIYKIPADKVTVTPSKRLQTLQYIENDDWMYMLDIQK